MAEAKAKTKQIVVYTGRSDERSISERDFQSVGVQGQKDMVWTKQTGHEVPASELNADAIRFLVEREREFEVREVPAD